MHGAKVTGQMSVATVKRGSSNRFISFFLLKGTTKTVQEMI